MQLQGVGVGRGIAIGPVLRMPEPLPGPEPRRHEGDPVAELAAVRDALAAVAAELAERGARVGGEARTVLEAAAMMAEDPTLIDDITRRIDAGTAGERAVFEAFEAFQQQLVALGGQFAERAADLADLARRTIARLRGVPAPGLPHSETAFLLVAADLAPADTALLDPARVLALITRDGGPTSHTAILARALSIPAIVGVAGALDLVDGAIVIADAASGVVTIDPGEAALAAALRSRARRGAVASAPITPGTLADGTGVPLLANLASPEEAARALELGAEGVGLFRTELLFLGSVSAPTIQQQAVRYTQLLRHFPGRRVVVRAFDAGADKPLAFLDGAPEPNPALGLRGLRALRAQETILRQQLQALVQAQASTDAELWVMAPMVADAQETAWFVDLGRSLGLRTVGVMAEVPSLAVLADQVLAASDFVSIGTNDLTQYTLAADRTNGSVARYQDPWHPAVLRLVKLLGDAGVDAGKPVGVCGEAAADPELAVVLVGLGVTSLSMTPAAFAEVRAELATVTLGQARAKAAAAIGAVTAAGARDAARSA
jgi:phosphotransferase system enzyme I (PtsI)